MTPAPEVAVGAVAVRDGHLLLIRRGHGPAAGRWSVPGGRVNFGEDLRAAVVRELLEETALEGVVTRFIGWVERLGTDPLPHHFVILDFEVDILDDRDPTPGDDATEARWVPLDDLSDLALVDGLHEFLGEHGLLNGAQKEQR
jgi:ADP-ribose pyrophosphatase YjhB (NUDIX family)